MHHHRGGGALTVSVREKGQQDFAAIDEVPCPAFVAEMEAAFVTLLRTYGDDIAILSPTIAAAIVGSAKLQSAYIGGYFTAIEFTPGSLSKSSSTEYPRALSEIP